MTDTNQTIALVLGAFNIHPLNRCYSLKVGDVIKFSDQGSVKDFVNNYLGLFNGLSQREQSLLFNLFMCSKELHKAAYFIYTLLELCEPTACVNEDGLGGTFTITEIGDSNTKPLTDITLQAENGIEFETSSSFLSLKNTTINGRPVAEILSKVTESLMEKTKPSNTEPH